jgi:hypothetical protein
MTKVHVLSPYFKATFGPVYVEGQVYWGFGDAAEFESPSTSNDEDMEGKSAYIKAKYNFGPGDVGAQFAYISGDDPKTDDYEGGMFVGNGDWSPCFIMYGEKYSKWTGGSPELNAYTAENVFFYQVFGSYKVLPKLKLAASISYAEPDEKIEYSPGEYSDEDYGTEFDISATYMIYNNLSYMVGFGYLKAGDLYKDAYDGHEDDNYVIINKLQLKF